MGRVLTFMLILTAWDFSGSVFMDLCLLFKQVSKLEQVSKSVWILLESQYKRSTAGKLDAANYAISRAAQLIKQTISAHHSGSEYRGLSLDTCESDITLERKMQKRLD